MDCPANSTAAACIAPPAVNTCASRGGAACLVRQPSYADILRRPPPAPALTRRGSSSPPPPPPTGQVLGRPVVQLPFSQLQLGRTTSPWHGGSWRVRACSVRGNVFRVEYPRGSSNFDSGGPEGGCSFKARPHCLPATDVTLSYSVAFPHTFEWSRGGKLPGLFVGYGEATGGHKSATAASCRLMWQREGGLVVYVYLPTGVRQNADYARVARKNDKYGDMLFAAAKLTLQRTPSDGDDIWNAIVMRVKLNSFDSDGVPVSDGTVSISVNGQAASFTGIIWRRRRNIQISHISFTTFYGGKWRCPRDTHADFKDVSCIA